MTLGSSITPERSDGDSELSSKRKAKTMIHKHLDRKRSSELCFFLSRRGLFLSKGHFFPTVGQISIKAIFYHPIVVTRNATGYEINIFGSLVRRTGADDLGV